MSAIACECGHGKSDHVLLSRECRNPDPAAEDCVCTKFRPSTPFAKGGVIKGPVTAVTFDPSVETIIPAAEVRERGRQALAAVMGESTSAALARVTAELAEARQDVEIERTEVANLRAVQAERDKLRTDLASLAEGFRRTIGELTAERDEMVRRKARVERDLGAQLAEAREQLADLTVAARRAARSWMVARDGGRDCILCGHEIRRGEAYETNPGADELQHVHCRDAAPAADVVTAYDCLYCRTCFGRYFEGTHAAENHEHPLVPVTVTITLREGHR